MWDVVFSDENEVRSKGITCDKRTRQKSKSISINRTIWMRKKVLAMKFRVNNVSKYTYHGQGTFYKQRQCPERFQISGQKEHAGDLPMDHNETLFLAASVLLKYFMNRALHSRTDVDRLYLKRMEGGQGLQCLEEVMPLEEFSLAFYLSKKRNYQGKL